MKGFKDLDTSYVDVITKLVNEEATEYDKVFHAAMKKFNISSPDELGSDERKKEFFDYVDSQYVSKDEKNESYASDYKKFAAQHPEQDMTEQEAEDWRNENQYGDAANKAAMKEGKFYEKKFPTRKHKIVDNADINSIIDRRAPSPTYNQITKEGKSLSERAESQEKAEDAEPVTQSGLDVANSEPNSAVGFRNDPIPPKRVDVLCDIDRSDPNNPKKSYRLWCQYPTGQVSIHPAPNEPGMEFIEDLSLLDVPNSADAIAHALDVAKKRPAHRGVNEASGDYKVYHSSFSGAVQEVLDFVKRKGFSVNEDEYFNTVSTGPKKPSPGKTNRYTLSLEDKMGKKSKKSLHFQVYGMEAGKYELNLYIS